VGGPVLVGGLGPGFPGFHPKSDPGLSAKFSTTARQKLI